MTVLKEKPIFKPHFHVEPVDGEGVFLLTENGHTVLTGRIYELVAPLIDGQRSPDEIVDRLSGKLSPEKAYYALAVLEKKGYIMENYNCKFPGTAAFWTANGLDPGKAEHRLKTKTVSIASFGGIDVDAFMPALASLGIRTGDEADFNVVLTDDYLRAGLSAYNREALEKNRPWILIKPVGQKIFLGPVFYPEKTGCWMCLETRYALNREAEKFVMEKKGRNDPLPLCSGHTPATLQVAFNMAATEIAKWIANGKSPELEGKIRSLDTITWQMETHVLTRRPQCPACGDRDMFTRKKNPAPVRLRRDKVAFTGDGGHRTASPDETVQKYQHLVSPITGVVNLLERDQSVGSHVHVYLAGHNFAFRHDSLGSLKAGLRSMSAGKGMSKSQAMASGLCEAVERHSGLFEGYEPRILSSIEGLGEKAIHPNSCMLFSKTQYRNRDAINAGKSKFNHVPELFEDTAMEIEWSPVWSLTRERFKYLPTQYLYYGYQYPDGSRKPAYFNACSNGNASGNTLEEAVLQGFFELVERDCVALWWYNMLKKPAVDIESFEEPYFRELIQYYKTLNRSIWVLDITSDLCIPTFAAISKRTDQKEEHIIFGFGCHLDARSALQRALTEMNQSLPHVLRIFGENSTIPKDFRDDEAVTWWKTATCENQPLMSPDTGHPVKKMTDYPETQFADILDEILVCQKRVEDLGMEMLVLDQTRPDIGVPVAKVIVPGLRHFWARFAPGRLYEVPVKMGWLDRPPAEEALNPIPMFF